MGARKPSNSAPITPAQEHTVVGYYFCDEPIPYRTQLPGKQITLAMFKNLIISKRGNYRYESLHLLFFFCAAMSAVRATTLVKSKQIVSREGCCCSSSEKEKIALPVTAE